MAAEIRKNQILLEFPYMDNTISTGAIFQSDLSVPGLSETIQLSNAQLPLAEKEFEVADAVKVTLSKEAVVRSHALASSISAGTEVVILSPEPRREPVLSRDDVENLFSSVLNLSQSKTIALSYFISDAISSDDRTLDYGHLFSALTTAGAHAGDMVDQLPKLGVKERDLFLSIAARSGKDESAGLIKIAKRLGDSSLHTDFLTIASELEGEELANFIKAALDNPDGIAKLINKTGELKGVDQKNFLAAAAGSPDLNLLIQHIDLLDKKDLSDFLFAAKRAGKAQEQLIILSNQLSRDEMQKDILPMASSLSSKEFEDYLFARKNAGEESSSLKNLVNNLEKDQRYLFLKAAAGAGGKTSDLIAQVSDLQGNSTDLDNFLHAANRTENIDGLISLTRKAKENSSDLLSLAGGLNSADLHNFLGAAQKMESSSLGSFIDMGKELSGIEQSHFFFGALKAENSQNDYLHLAGKLRGNERSNLLLIIANSKTEDVHSIINKTENIADDENRSEFLASAGLEITLSEAKKHEATYIHLKNFFSAHEFDNFLNAVDFAGSDDEVERLLETSDMVDDRASFLATASDSKGQIHNFLDLTDNLSGERRERLLEVATKLDKENLQNFVETASQTIENLDEFVTLTGSLTGSEKHNFLKASVDAVDQDMLGEFIDLTDKVGGPARSMFLITAGNAGGQLGNLIEATSNFILSEKNSFMAAAKENEFKLDGLFEDDSKQYFLLRENGEENIDQFFRAAKQTGFDIDLIFSHDKTGYHFKNKGNSEYINQFLKESGKAGFDFFGRFVLRRGGESGIKLAGTTSGGIFRFMENAFASKNFLGSYLKPYL